jgi:hypothetical protein
MKMRLTISDENGGELVSHFFDIAGSPDYQQATDYMWDRLREKLAKREGDGFWNNPTAGSKPITPRDAP